MTRFAHVVFVVSATSVICFEMASAQLGVVSGVVGAGLGAAAAGGGRWYEPYGYGGYGGYGYGGFASTPAQGYMQGMASVIRAEGQAAQYQSQAAINYEQAR